MADAKLTPASNAELDNKYLIFMVDEHYAIELKSVIEIVECREVTAVPETPPYVEGVVNLRGTVIPVINLRTRFKKSAAHSSVRQCIIVTEFEGAQIGLIVDNVVDLVTLEPDKVSPPPQVGANYAHVFIKELGVQGDQMYLIVDTDKLVNLDDLHFLEGEESQA